MAMTGGRLEGVVWWEVIVAIRGSDATGGSWRAVFVGGVLRPDGGDSCFGALCWRLASAKGVEGGAGVLGVDGGEAGVRVLQ